MDTQKLKDYGSTMIGGGTGLEQIYQALDMLNAGPPTWAFAGAMFKGILLMAFGYLAYRTPKA